ncbi:MAG: carboxypeptidase-like regulatory domain-containing protein [Planctomycetaceae bacterium]|jgi:hypothetical protein|nr:carboxypeptidase-like regulatory domain-containing protein [Planctomycetaceae bacterium]
MIQNSLTCLCFVFLVLSFLGCGEPNRVGAVKVSGTVTVDGQPMEGITVIFNPVENHGTAASGTTDAQGGYVLTSPGAPYNAGAAPGQYIPTFSKTESEILESTSIEDYKQKYGNRIPKTFHLIPEKYSKVKTCGIEPCLVEKGKSNTFDFELSTK